MDEQIRRMIRGFRHFRDAYFKNDTDLFHRLRHGQNPKVLVIACSDSRVDPALLTGSEPGDLFVIRNIANLVPPYEPDARHHGVSAALEYAVRTLEVGNIIVLGHSGCGGIDALMREKAEGKAGEFLGSWLEIAEPARQLVEMQLPDASRERRCRACEEAALLLSLENLLTFPWIREHIEAGRLAIHGWYFHLGKGRLFFYDPQQGHFCSLS